ncbi:MAG TPA: hypothetical protein VFC79_02690 [Tissierellaceae bacterium]|nr:hypothetical protein [Tissierellaceae bacterium]
MRTGIFYLDGKNSMDYNLYSVELGDSVNTVASGVNLIEKETAFSYNPLFQQIKREPYDIPLKLALVNEYLQPLDWTPLMQERALSFLLHKEYKEIVFERDLDRVQYVIPNSEVTLYSFLNKGYIELTYRTNSPYSYRPKKEITINAENADTTIFLITDEIMPEEIYPTIELERVGQTNSELKIYKDDNPSDYISFSSLGSIENIKILCGQQIIKDVDSGNFIYNYKTPNVGDKWLSLKAGQNKITLSQGWKAKIKYQEVLL